MEKYPQNTRQDKINRKRVPIIKSYNSCSPSLETRSDHSTDDIMSMVMQEKAAAFDPEKRSSMDAYLGSDSTPVRQGRRLSTPGAFRFGTDDDGARSIAGDSEGSASCIIMIPRASLVDNEIEEKDKDLEAPTSTVAPMVYAEKSTESLKSAPPQKKSRKRAFRLCMILLCLLVAGLLGGVLYFLLKDDSSSALESSTTDDSNLFERPPPRNDDEGGGRGDGKPPRDD
jgi:hypothetical protein